MTDVEKLIAEIVEGEAVRAPLFVLSYPDVISGRSGAVRHEIRSLIYSEFDARLSRHLHATQGVAFPSVEVITRFDDGASGASGPRSAGVAQTILDALERIGASALRDVRRVEMTLDFDAAGGEGRGARRVTFDAELLEAIRASRRALEIYGDPALCRVTSDLHGAAVFLPGAEDELLFEVDFQRAMLNFPECGGSERVRVPLLAAESEAQTNAALVGRMRLTRDMLMRARKGSVDSFCRLAEREVSDFDRSLGRRGLTGFRREIALDLVERLKLAFGEALKGLSPHARLLAFDWAHGDPEDAPERDRDRLIGSRQPVAAE